MIALEESEVGDPWRTLAAVLNWTTWLIFAIEVTVMLAVVPDRKRWRCECSGRSLEPVLQRRLMVGAIPRFWFEHEGTSILAIGER